MTILEDYYKAKLTLELLTLEVKEKQEAVMAYLESQPDGKAEIKNAKFTIRKTPVYGNFSSFVKNLEEDIKEKQQIVKDTKKQEVESGVATIVDEAKTVMMVKAKEK